MSSCAARCELTKHSVVSHARHAIPTPPLLFMMCPIPVASVDFCQKWNAGAASTRTKAAMRICPNTLTHCRAIPKYKTSSPVS